MVAGRGGLATSLQAKDSPPPLGVRALVRAAPPPDSRPRAAPPQDRDGRCPEGGNTLGGAGAGRAGEAYPGSYRRALKHGPPPLPRGGHRSPDPTSPAMWALPRPTPPQTRAQPFCLLFVSLPRPGQPGPPREARTPQPAPTRRREAGVPETALSVLSDVLIEIMVSITIVEMDPSILLSNARWDSLN